MNRLIDYRYSEAIAFAFELLDEPIAERLRYINFLTGSDPIFVGLHNCQIMPHEKDRRSYRNTAHVCFPWNALNPRTTITTVVLPTLADANPYIIIHELGHCLDEILGFEHIAIPINDYAKTDRLEAFAAAFSAQYFWLELEADNIFQSDRATQALFRRLREG